MPTTPKHAGEWRGLPVAIKTVVFQSGAEGSDLQLIASEAAIASNLAHRNIVATYNHDVRTLHVTDGSELPSYKFYLVQVRRPAHP